MWMGSGDGASDTPHTATTDPDGTFRFDGLPKEKLQLVARHADYLEAESAVDVSAAGDTDIEPSRGGTLAGVVVGADGAPVEGAAVAMEGTGAARSEWNG